MLFHGEARERADKVLVLRGFFPTRAQAQAAIAEGRVLVCGVALKNAAQKIPVGADIIAEPAHPWVSRGGVKLDHALTAFNIDPAGLYCLDVGASTGGFTDVLLARRARHVVAIDVGHSQLHPRLRQHVRVNVMEETDIRTLEADLLDPRPTLAVIDVSFISLTKVLPAVARVLAPQASIVALIKPQFEVGRAGLAKGGIVRDPALQDGACKSVREALEQLGFNASDPIASPIAGGSGNAEFLIAAHRELSA